MLYNKRNHPKLKYVQPQSSPLQGENGGKIYSTWNPGKIYSDLCLTIFLSTCKISPAQLKELSTPR
jgi:hypothetical protein